MKTKKKKWQDKLDIDGGNNDVENRAEILYNDTVDQLKGMWRSLVASLFWIGYKMSRVPILSSLPSPLGSNEG